MNRMLRLAVAAAATTAAMAMATIAAEPAFAATPATTISSTPKAFSTTDGDILAITKVVGLSTPAIAIGGNFQHVITPDGVWHAASFFAILNESTGAVLYAGKANSYVRAITSVNGTTYLGGDFTTYGGVARSHAAAVSSTFAVTSWNPAPGQRVRGLAADSTGVYLTGDFVALRKSTLSAGTTVWSKGMSGGGGRAVLLLNGAVYVGGLFNSYNGTARPGLAKVAPTTGDIDPAFNAKLRANTGVGTYGAFDGEEVLSLAAGPSSGRLVVGVGGHAPAGLLSNEIAVVNASTGARFWRQALIGDGQAVAVAGGTDVAGYHRNAANTTVPYPYFAAQFNDSNGALTPWDPKVTGNQSNADGGNNGVQAMYADPVTKTLFIGGAFVQWNGTSTHKSLIAFSWA
jgi:hypothetical protein